MAKAVPADDRTARPLTRPRLPHVIRRVRGRLRSGPVQRAILALGALLALALVGPAPVSPVHAQTAVLKLPFAAGTSWRIIQGYEGGTHGTGPERYALDLVREGGP